MEFLLRMLPTLPGAIILGLCLQKLFPHRGKAWKRLLLYAVLGMVFCMPAWIGDENPMLMFPFFMLGFLIALPGDRLPRLVMGGIFYTLLVPLNMLLDSLYCGYGVQMASLIFRLVFWCCLAWVLGRVAPPGGLALSPRLWALLGSLTLGPLAATLSFSFWGYRLVENQYYDFYLTTIKRLGYSVLPFVLVSALALLVAALVLSRHQALEQQSQLAALREVYYTGLNREQLYLRTLRHDLRNHVTALQGLLEQGKSNELAQYLQNLADSPALNAGAKYCQNETANVVLSSKAIQIETAGLVPRFSVQLPPTLSLPAPELCALLGNALDNAIAGAACGEKGEITLQAKLEKGMFLLQVQNAIARPVNPDFSTTKGDAARHGLGLGSMREIAQRHGGTLEATAQNGIFSLLIYFPCQDA